MRHKLGFGWTLPGLLTLTALGVAAGGTLAGCAVAPASIASQTVNCSAYPHQQVVPATATADHTAAAPGNQQKFTFPLTVLPAGCAQAQYIVLPTWVSSDPVNAPISNANDATNGVATCVGATTPPVTISTTQEGTASVASLTCK